MKTYYPEPQITDLLNAFDIPESQQAKVKQSLNQIAANWEWCKGTPMPETRVEARKKLQKVATQAAALVAAINDLGQRSNSAFLVAYDHVQTRCLQTAIMSNGKAAPADMPLVVLAHSDPTSPTIVSPDVEDMDFLLRGLIEVAEKAANIPEAPRGQTRDEALNLWVGNVARLWQTELGRPFTRDVLDNGEPVSEAARFVVEAYALMDPETPSSRVLNAMKQRITRLKAEALEE